MWVQFLGQEDPPEEGVATHSSVLAWRIPWAEDPRGGLGVIGLQRAGHDWSDSARRCRANSRLECSAPPPSDKDKDCLPCHAPFLDKSCWTMSVFRWMDSVLSGILVFLLPSLMDSHVNKAEAWVTQGLIYCLTALRCLSLIKFLI